MMKNEWIRQIRRNTGILNLLLKGMTADQLATPLGESNTVGWIVGHLTRYRGDLLRAIGGTVELEDWEAGHERGAEKQAVGIDLDLVLPAFENRGKLLMDRIHGLTDEFLKQKSERVLPDGGDDMGGFVSFLIWHETFHLGQIDLIQAGLGIGGIR